MTDKCPVCSFTNVNSLTTPPGKDVIGYDCPRCGPYVLSRAAEAIIKNDAKYALNLPKLSAWIRAHKERGNEPPEINSHFLDNELNRLPEHNVRSKQLLLLRAIERRTQQPGDIVRLYLNRDSSLAYTVSSTELRYLIDALAERGFVRGLAGNVEWVIECGKGGKRIPGTQNASVVISPDGWNYLDKLTTEPAFPNQAFVAMWFDPEMDETYEKGIRPAIEESGYKPIRIDRKEFLGRIDDEIVAEIRDCRFVVADVTEQRQGVYWEAGYAHGLGREVIWCVKKDEMKKVHFDTNHFNHITWNTSEELKEKLYQRIRAIIGVNPSAAGTT